MYHVTREGAQLAAWTKNESDVWSSRSAQKAAFVQHKSRNLRECKLCKTTVSKVLKSSSCWTWPQWHTSRKWRARELLSMPTRRSEKVQQRQIKVPWNALHILCALNWNYKRADACINTSLWKFIVQWWSVSKEKYVSKLLGASMLRNRTLLSLLEHFLLSSQYSVSVCFPLWMGISLRVYVCC